MVAVGDGATLYAADLAAVSSAIRVLPHPQLAGAVGLLAVNRGEEALDPSAVRPLYVRRPDVEVTRDEKLLKAAEVSKDT